LGELVFYFYRISFFKKSDGNFREQKSQKMSNNPIALEKCPKEVEKCP
jgi:hypothetical protein